MYSTLKENHVIQVISVGILDFIYMGGGDRGKSNCMGGGSRGIFFYMGGCLKNKVPSHPPIFFLLE